MSKADSVDELLKEAIENIREDRAVTGTLLTDLMVHMKKLGDQSHDSFGGVAAKYVETLQRSNEQLVKLTSMLKKEASASARMTDDDKEDLFAAIEEHNHGAEEKA